MSKTLTLGDLLPDLTLPDQNQELIRLHDFIDQCPLVIYFYPKDETSGCTAQACSFRDQYQDFESLNARVIGISGDSVKSHARFAKRHQLNFTLLSDANRKAEKAFGVKRNVLGLIPGRVTFVFDKAGRLIHEYNSAVLATKHIPEALKALRQIQP